MAKAVFEVVADASSVVSVLSSLPPLARRVATLMRGSMRQAFDSTAKGAEEMRNSVAKSYLQAGAAARKHSEEAAKAEKARTRATKAEAGYRTNARKREADEAIREERRITSETERESRRRTAAAQRTARARAQFAARWTERGFNAATSFGSTAHGMIQGARQMNAVPERLIGSAVYQAGGDRAERDARMAQARAISMRTGLSMADIGEAMSRSQSEFNALAGDTPAARNAAFERFSRTMDFAARTNTNASEAARLQGMLSQLGISTERQDTLMRFAAGAAQSGSVEVGDLTREALSSINRRMGDSTSGLGPNATAAQREAAMEGAFRQQVAALQVFKAGGDTPRAAGLALARTQEMLRDPTRQDKLLTNIRTARDRSADPAARARYTALISTLFERDPTRTGNAQRVRANYQDPMALQAALFRATNGDATASANILAGGGHGNPQSFLANQRALFGALGRTDAQGVTGAERVRRLTAATLTNEDLNRGAAIFQNDAQAELNREETQRVAALTDNSRALVQLSNQLAKFSAANPLASAAAGGVGASIAGGLLTRGAGAAVGGMSGAVAAAGGGLAGVATVGAAATAAGVLGLSVGDIINTHLVSPLMDRDRTELQRQQNARTSEDFSIFRNGFSILAHEIREAFSSGAVTARVAPQDAQHAATQAAAGRPASTAR